MDKSQEFWETELAAFKSLSEEELAYYVERIYSDFNARDRIFEGMQKRIFDAATAYETDDILKMDLIQEGNMALLDFLGTYEGKPDEFSKTAMKRIKKAMRKYATEEEKSIEAGEALKVKLNVIDEICVRIAEETGREATAKEIAELLQTDEDEIKYLMQIALSAVKKE